MTQNEAVAHWQKRARVELKTAKILFEQDDPDFYGEVLFHCHLAVELALKAEYLQKTKQQAPFIHNLGELATSLGNGWTDEELDTFDQLSDLAILTRYGDERWFKEEATKENAAKWIAKAEQFLSNFLP